MEAEGKRRCGGMREGRVEQNKVKDSEAIDLLTARVVFFGCDDEDSAR